MPDNALGSTASFGVIESPRDNLWPIPEAGPELFGHCFLLRLDPVACVAALEDQDAMCAASLVPREWFLGIALPNDEEGHLYDPEGEPFLGFKFCFVRSGLPELEHASVPIAPSECATGCPPSLTVTALPWEDLHVHTHHPMAAVVSRIHYTAGQRVARLDASTLDKVVHRHRTTEPSVNWKKDQRLETSALAQENQLDVPNAHNEDGNSQRALPGRVQDRLAQLRIFVEVWLDPAAHPGPLADPAKFKEATSRVEEIWRDWQARMLEETGSYGAPIDPVASAQEPTRIVLAEEGIQPAETLLTMPTATGCPESIRPSSDISQPRLNPEFIPSARKLPLVSLRLRGALSKLRARFARAQALAMPEPK